MADGGYDVSDYCDIDPRFGTLADADALLADAHALGLRVIVDLVANHTSERASVVRRRAGRRARLAGAAALLLPRRPGRRRGAAERLDQRLRRPRVDPVASRTADRGSGTCTLFAPEQPDLDWDEPAVREDVRRRPAVLVRPRRRRHPGRRGPGHGEGARAARRRARARRAVRVAHLGRQPALGRRRRARHPPAVAGASRTPTTATGCSSPRPSSATPSGSAATCGRTRCTRASTSTT